MMIWRKNLACLKIYTKSKKEKKYNYAIFISLPIFWQDFDPEPNSD